jgi:prophage DNA circulation protein
MQDKAQAELDEISNQMLAFTYTDSLFTKFISTPQQLKKVQSDFESNTINAAQRTLIEKRIEQHVNQLRK